VGGVRLAEFFAAVGPFLEGRVDEDTAARALYGDAAAGSEAARARRARLALYGRFCRLHRHSVLESVYEQTHATVLRLGGEAGWDALVEDYFRAHPMRHFELNANGAGLPGFLGDYARGRGWPEYLAELADLEWWWWQMLIAVDDPGDDESGDQGRRLRLASTTELRPYRHDLVTWLDTGEEPTSEGPAARATIVLFWRDRDLYARRENATEIELLVLKAVSEGQFPAALIEAGLPQDDVLATLADLSRAGVILGTLGTWEHEGPGGPRHI
jgi:hypothetical protein